MTEIEKALESAKPERPRRQLPIAWLVLTGVLILLTLITLGVGKYRDGRALLAMSNLAEKHAAAVKQMQQQQDAQAKALIKQQGESIARSFQMINPLLLTDRGQAKALGFFASLGSSNSHIKYIVLYDDNGAMCATTNLFLGNVAIPAGMTDEIISKKGVGDADVQYFGPITDSNGQRVGTVLVGMSFTGKEPAAAAVKPNAVAPENVEPAQAPLTAAPPAAAAPPAPTMPPAAATAPDAAAPEAPDATDSAPAQVTQ
ncbi:MAG: hypothetical protein ACYDCO_00425 [Armatimonadota bacterium]